MATIKDIRHRTKRTNGTRSLSAIKNIARHHSATPTGNFDSFWRTWNGVKGWGTGGYHEIILRDGTVELCYDPHEITNGVGGHNSYIYHICVVGNGSFTAEQERVFDERARYWMKRLGLPVEAVKGHREFPGASTACPGIDMNMVRRRLKLGSTEVAGVSADALDYKTFRYGQMLTEGMGGAAAKRMQEDLTKLGYPLVADGILGEASDTAIRAFQLANGLTVDGYAGKATQDRITELLNALNKPKPKPAPDVAHASKPKEDKPVTNRDVLETHREAWEWAEREGLLNGENPAGNVSREQFATVLKRDRDQTEQMVRRLIQEIVFGADREVSAAHREAWERATEAGLTNGERPGAATSREQLMTILDRAGVIPEKENKE